MTLISLNSLISHQESLTEMVGTCLPALQNSGMQQDKGIDGVTQKDANRESIDG